MDDKLELTANSAQQEIAPSKADFARKAFNQYSAKIMMPNGFLPEEAESLLVTFAAYRYELLLHQGDLVANLDHKEDLEWAKRFGLGRLKQQFVDKKIPYSAALVDARQGRLKMLKDLVLSDFKDAGDFTDSVRSLVSLVPDIATKKVRLPYPAWMDPRFNPDASLLPLKPVETQG